MTSLPLVALYLLGAQAAGLPLVPFDLFEWLSRLLPGSLIARSIDLMVAAHHRARSGADGGRGQARSNKLMALALVVGTGVLMGAVLGWVVPGSHWRGWQEGAAAGALLAVALVIIELLRGYAGSPLVYLFWLALPALVWGAAVGYLVERVLAPAPAAAEGAGAAPSRSRRDLLVKIAGGAAGAAIVLGVLATLTRRGPEGQPVVGVGGTPTPAVPLPTPPKGRLAPAPGTRPELTPEDTFYQVNIGLLPTVISEDHWRLDVGGLFAQTGQLTLAELRALPAVTMPYTLSCISNPVAGDLIGTAYWTGTRLRDFLQARGLRPEAKELFVRSGDGFYETVVMADMLDQRTLLVYGMNGHPLAAEHGFPLRVLIPDRYGMKQPKWITHLEAMGDAQRRGYWPEREWSLEAQPQIVSVIDDVVAHPTDAKLAVAGGIAWAGARGHLQGGATDGRRRLAGGEADRAAARRAGLDAVALTTSRVPLERTTIAPAPPTVAARCSSQIVADPYPDGATGYHYVVKTV